MEVEDEDRILDEPIVGESISGQKCGAGECPAAKRSKATPDWLSELPDLAIVHILSHLYFEEAARTSLLSKRFYSLWNSVSGLNFSDASSGKSGNGFVNFVDTALGFHRRSDVDKFSVKFRYDVIHSKAVGGWIKRAVQKQVKSLHLILLQDPMNQQCQEHKLPKFLFSYQKLVELVTCCCKFAKIKAISWNSLKLLSITRTKLNEGLISRVLSGCPVLETLELIDWSGFDRLMINSTSLRVLRIRGEQTPKYVLKPDDECVLEISGPNLVTLEISGPLYRNNVRLMDVGSLVNATMNFETRPHRLGKWYAVTDEIIAREVLESLCLVNSLTVGGWFIMVLSRCEAYSLSYPWAERKILTLSTPVIRWDHFGVASILHSSPYLETLVIKISCCSDKCALWHSDGSSTNYKEESYWKSWKTKSRCALVHLKTVKVVSFHASCGATKLVHFLRFLLSNGEVLEDVIIEASQFVTKEAIDEFMTLLSDSIPKASPDVVVQFEPPHFWVVPPCICKGSGPLF